MNEQQEYLRVLESPKRERSTDTISEEDMTFLFDHEAAKHIVQRVWQTNEFMTPDEVMQRVDKVIEKHGAYSMEAMELMNQMSKYLAQVISDPKISRAEGVRLMEKAVEYAEKAKAIIEEVKANPDLIDKEEAFGVMSTGGMTYVDDAHRDLEQAKQRLANEPNEIAARTPPAQVPVEAKETPLESTAVAQSPAKEVRPLPTPTPTPKPAAKPESKNEGQTESSGSSYLIMVLAGLVLALCLGFSIYRYPKRR